MNIELLQKQSTNLVMTNELRQAISLLQYSTLDLIQFINDQTIDNPLIEVNDDPLKNHFEIVYNHNSLNQSATTEKLVNPIDYIKSDDTNLWDELLHQIVWLDIDKKKRSVIRYLILNLDENGYLTIDNQEIISKMNATETEVEKCIQYLQQLEPLGIGARNLKECLLIQARVIYPTEPLIPTIIIKYLDQLADKKWQEIARRLNITLSDVIKLSEYIQTLNPKPCSEIANSSTQYLIPDIIFKKDQNNYVVSMNDHYLPTFTLNQKYIELMNHNNEASKYIRENYQRYVWLKNSIEKRRETILKIANIIVEKQRGFLENGLISLQPMTLKEVADAINIHESTVSRATRNKVIQTANGAYEMQRLFTSKLGRVDSNNASSTQVKLLLEEIINTENKQKPYSDQGLANYLSKYKGINVSRRTIAKYREELKILASSKRKSIV